MYVNKNIKSTNRIFPMQGRYDFHRYDMNENPEGLPKDFVNSVVSKITPEFLAIYPEPDKFQELYADFIGLNAENILATNGSDMAIRYIFETFGEPGKDVVTVAPSFEMYWVNCSILGLNHVPVHYEKDMAISVPKIIDSITDNTRIVVLLNPNNPIGNVYTEEEVESIVEKAKQHNAIVIIDEAYYYFYDKTFQSLIGKNSNVIILRTFSKLFSIAACRLGVVISSPEIINYLKKCKLTFDVNSIALLFGSKLLKNKNLIDELIKKQKDGKEYVLRDLELHDYEARDCTGNYIFIKPNLSPKEIEARLILRKILIKTYSNELLKPYIRVSIGSIEAMKFFLGTFYELDNKLEED